MKQQNGQEGRRISKQADDLRNDIFDKVREYYDLVHAPQGFDPASSSVPVSGRVFDSHDICSLVDSSLDFWLTTGRFNDEFEAKLCDYIGVKHTLSVNSGSSANLVALSSLTSPAFGDKALKPGDEVITCATGFPTTVNPILLYGLVPVFVDVEIPTYNIDCSQLEAAISDKTRAIMIAHALGNPFNLRQVKALANKYDLYLIEDCCDALGATYDGKNVGTFGHIGTLSFYPAHHITMGEGGAVFTNFGKMRRVMESHRDWGRDCYCAPGKDNTCGRRFDWEMGALPKGYDHKYIYSHLGYNLKITDMQAAVGLSQMRHIDEFVSRRRRNFDLMKEGFLDLQEYFILPEATEHSNPSWFGFPITLRDDAPFSRDQLVRHLDDCRIGTRNVFGGNLIRQPYMANRKFRVIGDLGASDTVMTNSFWLGVYPGLGDDHIEYILDVVHKAVEKFCKCS